MLAVGVLRVMAGGIIVVLTVALAVLVQPFAAVTVTEKVPACKPLRFCVVALLLQIKFVAVVVRLTAPLGGVQLVLSVAAALAVGLLGVLATVALAVLVQPFAAVTVTI